MTTPDSELYRLRGSLYGSGWEMDEIEQILDQASRDINEIVLDVVENAVAEAIDYAQELGIEEFITDVDVKDHGGYFEIGTISGITDFSTPSREMLPDLLKGAPENPNTGNKTKVIPVGKSSEKMHGDIFSVMREREKKIQETRSSIIDKNINNRSAKATQVAHQFRSVIQRNLASKRADTQPRVVQGKQEFRTASSTQDPSESWVYPARELNMTGFLMDLNSRIKDTLQSSVEELINSYIEEYG